MHAHDSLIGVAMVVLAALICGLVMTRLRQPAIVGYILAGVILGPSGFQLIGDRGAVEELAELGVLLLLFIVGSELSLRSFRTIWQIAVWTTAAQILGSLGAVYLLSILLGWPTELAIVIGFCVAISSTAVAVKMLEDIDELRTRVGRITVGVLLGQDLAVVPMLLIAANLGGDGVGLAVLGKLVLSLAVLVAVVFVMSARQRIGLPFAKVAEGHPDLAPLVGLGYCFGAATLSGAMGLSPAYGAFLAGLVIGNSRDRSTIMVSTLPVQSVLLMVFFLLIGLLIDLAYIWENLGTVLLLLFVVTVFKTAMNVGILRLLGEPWPRAFLTGSLLAQIGEFSFLIVTTAAAHGIIDEEAHRLVVAVTVLSLVASPFWLLIARRSDRLLSRRVDTFEGLIQRVFLPELRMLRTSSTRFTVSAGRAIRLARIRIRRLRRSRRGA